jgi:hypothetical protein
VLSIATGIFVGVSDGMYPVGPKKDREGANNVTDFQVVRNSRTGVEDLHTKFVTHHQILVGVIYERTTCLFLVSNHFVAVLQGVQVAATYTAGECLYQDVSFGGAEVFCGFDDNASLSGYGSSH